MTAATSTSSSGDSPVRAKINDDVEFFPHQVTGIKQMSKMSGALLADEMGLGKTLQALTVASIAFGLNETKRVLIVTPMTLKENWGEEMDTMTSFTYHILQGTPAQRVKQLTAFDKDVLVINYEQAVAHHAELSGMDFGLVIYDEAHYMKNRKSKRTKAAFSLVAGRHFLLTGSPLLNQVDDLWALLHRISPKDWGTYWSFVNRYAVYGGYMDKQIVGVKNEQELRDKLNSVMIRRTKDDELDLPDKIYAVETLEMHPEQAKLYKQARDELLMDQPGTDTPFEIENAMVKLLRLKQICGTTACIEGHPDHSSKLDRATEKIVELVGNGEPVIVFTQFREVQRRIIERLDKEGVSTVQLNGDTPAADRIPTVREWSTNAAAGFPQAIICMIQVAGVGLNMTAANHIVRLDKLFVPKLNEQGEDRAHRIGQEKPVTIHDFRMKGTVEARIERIIKQKKGIFGQVVDTDNGSWKKKLLEAVFEEDDE